MQRLKTRAQFQAVMAGSTVSRTPHFALHRTGLYPDSQKIAQESERSASSGRPQSPPTGPGSTGPEALFAVSEPWLGAMVPKRWAKRAVTRNAIKRQIYAVSRDYSFPVAAHVVRLRSGFDRAQFVSAESDALKRAVRAELQNLFAKAAA
ncbi:ribonuclease P protein component [Caenimonas sp. SL110]|uniref:ribonuclease P protein component n=1 Tax=Caenimonas sp. SL110 TaxID=1450524 RepID=UPI000652D56B|nr:ribonuclease P protein component [Caenimonas sp. SL110]